ncbi:glycoside hydrolase family 66 protein [Hymenobacter glacieicola]|uniref:Cycloisomaltooligosaccharide glucanotransferase n=1 Tax=Hymenobacter glacieicola TaxID=1562124 RepID=A0ABQ1WJK5_9BACT|nr:glycoside hydrolase family 66 protein [Hymenobacter glacieicola]GGG33810.1 cycloisomaltooligosaccharide glucanotransferase [Hymenobacter glacieicola]
MLKYVRGTMLLLGWLAATAGQAAPGGIIGRLDTDKAAYAPGAPVRFTADLQPAGVTQLVVSYYHLSTLLNQQRVAVGGRSAQWTWQPPKTDYQGYLVKVEARNGAQVLDQATTAVDVSSDWRRFPRYGFLSKFGKLSAGRMDSVMQQLTRYHLNGLQFYDWGDKHHQSLAGTPAAPAPEWRDLANRPTYLATVQGYIERAHRAGMKAMFYNLLYGAYPNAAADGVRPEWGLYKDSLHAKRYAFDGFPKGWEATGLDMQDPGNAGWQRYLLAEMDKVYAAQGLHFDGWHVDQVGDPGRLYTYAGQHTDPSKAFGAFLVEAKKAQPTRPLVMNAVNQWGQGQIAQAPVEFLYSELWTGNEQYRSLGQAIQYNDSLAPGKRTVLAAYINRDKSKQAGLFNPASVLLADAVIFAFGGAHIELGEHMLDTEYFPNSKLQLTPQLQRQVQAYYDFAVAYETLLRGPSRTFTPVAIGGDAALAAWPPQFGHVAAVGARAEGRRVVHLLNFTNATTLEWRDNQAQQPVPTLRRNVAVQLAAPTKITKIWAASPDSGQGVPQSIPFTQQNGQVRFTVPSLQYWTMLVLES